MDTVQLDPPVGRGMLRVEVVHSHFSRPLGRVVVRDELPFGHGPLKLTGTRDKHKNEAEFCESPVSGKECVGSGPGATAGL